jgi:hypothetical protein
MQDRLRFAEVYSRLADDELARVALGGNLVSEAQEALTAELEKRGLTDLGQYKRTPGQAAGMSSLTGDLQFQAGVKGKSSDRIFVLAAWVLAVSIPLVFLSEERPSSAILIRLCLVGGLFIAVSCYRGLRARADGSRKGFVLKFLVPLILLGASTAIVIVGKLLGLSL